MTLASAQPISQPSAQKLPWPFVVAALVAMAAIFISGTYYPGIPLFAVLFFAAYLSPWRLPDSKVLAWVIRATCWLLIVATSPTRSRLGYPILFEPDYAHLFAYCCAAELTLRVWTRTVRGPSRGEALLLTALIFIASTNFRPPNPNDQYIPYFSGVYALLLILSLRSMTSPPRGARVFVALRAVSIAAALLLGGMISMGLAQYEYKIMNWASQFTRVPHRGEIGLSATAQLGPVFNPKASTERVLLIEGNRSERHLRAMVFDTYDDRQWLPNVIGRAYEPLRSDLAANTDGDHLKFVRLTPIFDLLPLPMNTAGVISDQDIDKDAFGSLAFHDEPSLDIGYEAFVPKDEQHQGPMCVALDEAHRKTALAIPSNIDPKVRDLAMQVAGAGDAMSKVIKLAQHLRSAHSYSLSYDPGTAEPLSDFILNKRSAHCQYFASALVMMSRAVGVPSRYVSGYYAHEPYGDGLVVRERDAHAWAECFVEGVGWITMDATPSTGRPDVLFPEAPQWSRLWERISDLPRVFREWLANINWSRITWVLVIVGIVVLSTWIINTIRARRIVVAGGREYARQREELIAASARFDQWLAAQGIALRAHQTWREQKLPEASIQFVDAYDQARFGDDRPALERALAILAQLEKPQGG